MLNCVGIVEPQVARRWCARISGGSCDVQARQTSRCSVGSERLFLPHPICVRLVVVYQEAGSGVCAGKVCERRLRLSECASQCVVRREELVRNSSSTRREDGENVSCIAVEAEHTSIGNGWTGCRTSNRNARISGGD